MDMSYLLHAFIVMGISWFIYNRIKSVIIENKYQYLSALVAVSSNLADTLQKGVDKLRDTSGDDTPPEQLSLEELYPFITIIYCTELLKEINDECSLIKNSKIFFALHPEEQVKKRYAQYLPVYNFAYETFVLDKEIDLSKVPVPIKLIADEIKSRPCIKSAE